MSAWIFLRGLTRESRHWGNFPEVFGREVGAPEVITLDLPGNGSLNRLDSPSRVEAMAAFAQAELARQGVLPPYNLLAMSLGAMVAVAWATRTPAEVARCVLINTSLRPFSPFHHRLRPGNYLPLARLALIGTSAREREATILGLTSNRSDLPPGLLESWTEYCRERPVARRNALRQLLAAATYRAPLTKPATKLLILASSRDRLVDPRCSRELARRWGCELREHPSAGHDLPLDDGPWVAQQVGRWL